MKKYKLLVLCVGLLSITSCKYEEVPTYYDVDRIIFNFATNPNSATPATQDQRTVSLGYDTPQKSDSTIYIPLRVLGRPVSYERTVDCEIVANESTVGPADIEIRPSVIKADTVRGRLEILLHNTERLKTETVVARLRLKPNQYFHTDMEEVAGNKPDPTRDQSAIEFTVIFDAKNEMPNLWADYSANMTQFFGPYSNKKLEVICTVLGMTREYFEYDPTVEKAADVFKQRFNQGSMSLGWIALINRYLANYNEVNGHWMLDENGNEIKMGLPTLQ